MADEKKPITYTDDDLRDLIGIDHTALPDDVMATVTGAGEGSSVIPMIKAILESTGIHVEDEWIAQMLQRGGCALRNYCKAHAADGQESLCNIIPCQ